MRRLVANLEFIVQYNQSSNVRGYKVDRLHDAGWSRIWSLTKVLLRYPSASMLKKRKKKRNFSSKVCTSKVCTEKNQQFQPHPRNLNSNAVPPCTLSTKESKTVVTVALWRACSYCMFCSAYINLWAIPLTHKRRGRNRHNTLLSQAGELKIQ